MFIEKYPYTDFNEFNLDFILKEVKRLMEYFDEIQGFATIDYVDEELQKLNDKLVFMIDQKLDKATYDTFVIEVSNSLNSIANAIELLQAATAQNARDIVDTYNTLKAYIDTQVYNITVINPLNGLQQPIQLVLNDMANLLRGDALTAGEYDAYELTASAYDALLLTAYDYDNYGKNYIS